MGRESQQRKGALLKSDNQVWHSEYFELVPTCTGEPAYYIFQTPDGLTHLRGRKCDEVYTRANTVIMAMSVARHCRHTVMSRWGKSTGINIYVEYINIRELSQ